MFGYTLVEAFATFLRPNGITVTIESEVPESFALKKLCCHPAGFVVVAGDVGNIAES